MNCPDCRFFVPSPFATDKSGWCYRYPPQLASEGMDGTSDVVTSFPYVAADEWCGEYSAKEAAT